MGIQIDHTKARIPPPTQELIDEMALQMSRAARWYDKWDSDSEEVLQAWQVIAKTAYAVIAVHGGARRVEL